MATRKKKKGGSTSISVTFTAGISAEDKERAKKAINKIKGAAVKGWKAKPISGTARKVASAVASDLASGRKRRDARMRATGTKADASAKLAERKKQKATRGRVAAGKRKRSGAWGRGAGGG